MCITMKPRTWPRNCWPIARLSRTPRLRLLPARSVTHRARIHHDAVAPLRATRYSRHESERYVIVQRIFQQRFHARPGQPCLPALPLTPMTRHCVMRPGTAQARVRDHAGCHHVGDGPAVSVVRESVLDLPLCPVSRPGRRERCGGLHLFPLEHVAQLVCENRARCSAATAPQSVTVRPYYHPMLNSAPPCRAVMQSQVGFTQHQRFGVYVHRWAAQITFHAGRGRFVLTGWTHHGAMLCQS